MCATPSGNPPAVSSVGRDGSAWVPVPADEPGFVRPVGDRTVRFGTAPAAGDPLVEITAERAAGLTNGNALRWSPEERSPFGP